MNHRIQLSRISLVLAFATLSACSGGGGVSSSSSRASVQFPSSGALTDAASVVVRGATSGTDAVVAVEVNGVAATSTDSFATWQASITLQPGSNPITVVLTDAQGLTRTETSLSEVEQVGALLQAPQRLAVDSLRGRYLVLDPIADAVLAMDQTTGASSIVSGPSRGTGAVFQNAWSLAYDAGLDRIWVGDWTQAAIIAIDPTTGDRTTLIDRNSVPSGLTGLIARPSELVYDGGNQRLLVADAGSDTIYSVDVTTTGSASLISGGNTATSSLRRGSGASMFNITGMGWDEAGNRLITIDDQSDQILGIDLITGNRSSLSTNSAPAQPSELDFRTPYSLSLDATRRFAYTTNFDQPREANEILQIDLLTGMRSIFNGGSVGSGPNLDWPIFCQLDAANNRMLVGDSLLKGLYQIALDTGVRSVFSAAQAGSGPSLVGPRGSAVDAVRGRLLVTDVSARSLVAIDLATGDRSILALFDNQTRPIDVAVDTLRDRALVIDDGQGRLFAVRLSNGALTELNFDNTSNVRSLAYDPLRDLLLATQAVSTSAGAFQVLQVDLDSPDPSTGRLLTTRLSRSSTPAVGSGPSISSIRDIVVDADNDLLFAIDLGGNELLAIDLDTGNRSQISSSSRGTGPSLTSMVSMSLHPDMQRLLVLNSGGDELLAINITSGNRSIVTDPSTGSGPRIRAGSELALIDSRALVFDSDLGVISVDVVSGERVLTSSR